MTNNIIPQTYTDEQGTYQWVGSANTSEAAIDFISRFRLKWSKAIFHTKKIKERWIIYAIRKP